LAKARTDTLTKLGNRLLFHEELAKLLAEADFVADTAAVMTIDRSRFKAINESLGRHTGDELLGVVANRIRSALGCGDIAARLSGDKFVVLQTGQPQPRSAVALAHRLTELIGRSYLLEGQLINTAANVGIVSLPWGGADCEQILKNADLVAPSPMARGPGASSRRRWTNRCSRAGISKSISAAR
jgi:diguanylate cyclase (GGDEF)-like protein